MTKTNLSSLAVVDPLPPTEPPSPFASSAAPMSAGHASGPFPLTTIFGSCEFNHLHIRVHLSGFGRLWVMIENQPPISAWARFQPATWVALPTLGPGVRLRYSNYWLWYDARLCDSKGRALTRNLLLRGSIILYAMLVIVVALMSIIWVMVR